MGNVETSVTGIVLVFLGLTVAAYVVAIEITREHRLAIASNAKA